MSAQVETIAPEENAQAATERMARKQVRRLPVVEAGKLVARNRKTEMEAAQALCEISGNVKKRK